ncbi:DNA/RNA nuclease SfsA [Pontibacillus yanchengensis]|uniref:Sugar fermentation stimulation protein homolog n=1 Tax=Pontibacillus yanchengensis Y32 TaxID=1385514 RepID=A0A0A2T5U9_9BACI|nr:DNA/RNA nuclease SfsA [Pontibacillus yanchengensis]KGP71182.1 sugar fermentation stimulation protein [Pontibacillus yanchengensis Y32]
MRKPTCFIPFPQPLYPARFVKRSNRFILYCTLNHTGETVRVHMGDPGRLKELLHSGTIIYLSFHDSHSRKTNWSAVLVEDPHTHELVSLQTTLPNKLIDRSLKANELEEFENWSYIQREFTKGSSRFDFLLGQSNEKLAVEVKSVTLQYDGVGYFPDAVTDRGRKHVHELAQIAKEDGWHASILFVCQRRDISKVKVADWIDPAFAKALGRAYENGVKIQARSCEITLEGMYLSHPIPVEVEK